MEGMEKCILSKNDPLKDGGGRALSEVSHTGDGLESNTKNWCRLGALLPLPLISKSHTTYKLKH